MQKMTRNFVSIGFALALCVGIVGMAFAQETEEPAPNTWGVPSTTNGTFSIGVQTVFNGFLVTTPTKATPTADTGDTTIIENDDEDYAAKISISATYDNSDAPGVGYSLGVAGGIRRTNNDSGGFTGYFDSPWGKAFFLNKQLTLRAGGPEDPWTAWDDNWSYGDDPGNGAVQLNINPTALKGLNIGVTLPITTSETKADYPFKNMVAGFKLGGLIPYTTISAALKLKEVGPVTKVTGTKDVKEKVYVKQADDSYKQDEIVTGTVNVTEPVSSMYLNAALNFNFSPIQIRAEMQIADLDQEEDDLKSVSLDNRSVNFQLHPRLDLSLSKLADLGAFSLETLAVYAWIRSDPLYVSDGNSNTELTLEWAPSYKLTDAIKASLLFAGYFNVWGGDPTKEKTVLETSYAYNQVGFMLRPAVEFSIAPNAGIRLRDEIYFAQTGVDSERGIKNQVQVKFWWGF